MADSNLIALTIVTKACGLEAVGTSLETGGQLDCGCLPAIPCVRTLARDMTLLSLRQGVTQEQANLTRPFVHQDSNLASSDSLPSLAIPDDPVIYDAKTTRCSHTRLSMPVRTKLTPYVVTQPSPTPLSRAGVTNAGKGAHIREHLQQSKHQRRVLGRKLRDVF